MTDPAVPRLRVTTREVPLTGLAAEPLEHASPTEPLVWSRRGDSLVGNGVAWRFDTRGPAAAARAGEAWRRLVAHATVDDEVALAGTGLIAFGALPFSAESAAPASLIVPRIIVGRRAGRAWRTTIEGGADAAGLADTSTIEPLGATWSTSLEAGALGPEGYAHAVAQAIEAIERGEVHKVVLARELRGTLPAGADVRRLVRALSEAYPDTWTFAVDGLIGASPETLVTVAGGTVTARVLAGTAPRGLDVTADREAGVALAASVKDLDEHRFAVESVLAALRPHTRALVAAETPFTLKLPNVWHLATDVEGTVDAAASALDLVEVLHPTAAVAGTPTGAALGLIARLEPFDRGRYAGPVGWIDHRGDGEWAIALRSAQLGALRSAQLGALRSAQIGEAQPGAQLGAQPGAAAAHATDDPRPIVAHAGAGIVAGSDPATELAETRVKFAPIIDALR